MLEVMNAVLERPNLKVSIVKMNVLEVRVEDTRIINVNCADSWGESVSPRGRFVNMKR